MYIRSQGKAGDFCPRICACEASGTDNDQGLMGSIDDAQLLLSDITLKFCYVVLCFVILYYIISFLVFNTELVFPGESLATGS